MNCWWISWRRQRPEQQQFDAGSQRRRRHSHRRRGRQNQVLVPFILIQIKTFIACFFLFDFGNWRMGELWGVSPGAIHWPTPSIDRHESSAIMWHFAFVRATYSQRNYVIVMYLNDFKEIFNQFATSIKQNNSQVSGNDTASHRIPFPSTSSGSFTHYRL